MVYASFAEGLSALMDERGIGVRALARQVPCDAGYVSKLRSGKEQPSPELARRIDDALGAGGELAAALTPRPRAMRNASRKLPSAPDVSAVMYLDHGRRVIQALDVIDNDRLGGVADGLADLIDYYAQTTCILPPADVYDELLAVRSYVNRVIERAGLGARCADLVLATGWLSHLLAVAACDMGEHAAARVWCSDAERRSQEAGHPELAAWAALVRAMIAYYQGQPHQSITLVTQGQTSAPRGTVIHAKLAAQEMRAAAMIGDAARMTHARRHAAKAVAELPVDATTTGAFSIPLGEDPPYTATSLLLLGRFHEAVSATNRVIHTVYHAEARQSGGNPSGYARSLLILGLAQAGAGRLDEAVSAGLAALAGDRPAWPTMVLAGRLDQVLAGGFAGARQTAAYHDRYVEAAGHSTGHHLQLPGPAEEHE